MSTGERTADARTAAIEALTATLNAAMDEDEAAAKKVSSAWQYRDSWVWCGSFEVADVFNIPDTDEAGAHIARHDPARVLCEVRAKRDLLAAILDEPHAAIPGDEFYSCSQAADPDPAPGEGGPGSGCADPDRAGEPCDCGRNARVERLLRILAAVYGDGGR
jgi:hypothetical protein